MILVLRNPSNRVVRTLSSAKVAASKSFILPPPPAVVFTVAARMAGRGVAGSSAGSPGASRAVGQVMSRNPLAPFVPCHRVIGSNGDFTGFGGGLELKARLLTLEGHHAVAGPGGKWRLEGVC